MTTLPEPSNSGLPTVDDVDDEGLTLNQRFQLETLLRPIETCNDNEALKKLAHSTLKAWYIMKSGIGNKILEKLTEDFENVHERHMVLVSNTATQFPEAKEIHVVEEFTYGVDEKGQWHPKVQEDAYDTYFQPGYHHPEEAE
jgi:hypothetical protein